MEITVERLLRPCKCGQTFVDVYREDESTVVQAMICMGCGEDLR